MDKYYQTFDDALEENERNEERWQKWKKELKETRKNLVEYVKSYSHDIMVPIGKKAFIKGQLQHTNEITVCHGASGVFSDVSTSQALDILDQRIKTCDMNLDAINKEKDLFKGKIDLPSNLFANDEGQEIIEECDEAKEAEWRKKHAESVRKQKKLEAEERNKSDNEKDVFNVLDEYEMMEELADELEDLQIEDNETLEKLMKGEIKVPESKTRIAHSNVETPSSQQVHENNKLNISNGLLNESRTLTTVDCDKHDLIAKSNNEIVQLLKAYRGKIRGVLKSVNRADEGSLNLYVDLVELIDDIDDDIVKIRGDDDQEESEESDEFSDSDDLTATVESNGEQTRKRKVRFSTSLEDVKIFETTSSETYSECSTCSDTSDNQTIEINFIHSDAKMNAVTSDPDIIVSHPGEIKAKFSQSTQTQIATKSILKSSKSEPSTPTENGDVKKIFQSEIPVIGDVFEHQKSVIDENVVIVASKDENPKKVSKFRQMRSMKS